LAFGKEKGNLEPSPDERLVEMRASRASVCLALKPGFSLDSCMVKSVGNRKRMLTNSSYAMKDGTRNGEYF